MFELIIIIFILYVSLLATIVMIGLLLNFQKENKYFSTQKESIPIDNLVVIIPFRNEEKRISTIIESINKLTSLPKEFVFINDHSNDKTVDIIQDNLKIDNYRVLDLPENISGKKAAIRYGIQNSKSEFILTTDADVVFTSDYIQNISKLELADMYLMPVTMKAKKLFGELYEIDLILVNAVNVGLAGIKRPIMASGANLLFRRTSFLEYDTFESHQHISSGDDMYLLRDFRNNNADVRLISNPIVGIETETPQSFKEFIDQRLRWLGKTGNLKDHLSTTLSIVQAALTTIFFVLIFYYLILGHFEISLTILAWKTIIDLALFLPYFNRIKRLKTWIFIPLYELLFPFYTFLIIILMPFYKPKWKSRKIYMKSNL